MPAPDILRPTRVDAKLLCYQFPSGTATTNATILTVPANTVYRVRTMYAVNTSTTTVYAFSVQINDGVAARVYLRSSSIGVSSTFACVTQNDALYLEPGDLLQVSIGTGPVANIPFNVFVVYEAIT